MSDCKCDLRTRLVGDGCEQCNPQMMIDLLKEQVQEQADEIARLRLTDAEREFLQALHDAYQETANQTGSVNAAVQADSRNNAAIIRGLLERTK